MKGSHIADQLGCIGCRGVKVRSINFGTSLGGLSDHETMSESLSWTVLGFGSEPTRVAKESESRCVVMDKGTDDPWGSRVRVMEGKGQGQGFLTPGPSNFIRVYVQGDSHIVWNTYKIVYTCEI